MKGTGERRLNNRVINLFLSPLSLSYCIAITLAIRFKYLHSIPQKCCIICPNKLLKVFPPCSSSLTSLLFSLSSSESRYSVDQGLYSCYSSQFRIFTPQFSQTSSRVPQVPHPPFFFSAPNYIIYLFACLLLNYFKVREINVIFKYRTLY